MARRPQRFTIYDMMEEKGIFEANPANVFSRSIDNQSLYTGPVEFPKMLYHPTGEHRVIVQAVAEMTPFGPQMRGEQRELIWSMADDVQMEAELLAKGWHLHPQDAIRARDGLAPLPKAKPGLTMEDLARQNAELLEQLKKLQSERDD